MYNQQDERKTQSCDGRTDGLQGKLH